MSKNVISDNDGPVTTAVDGGSSRDQLVALRRIIALAIDAGCLDRDLASLSRRLIDITLEIEAIGGLAELEEIDADDARSRPPDEPYFA